MAEPASRRGFLAGLLAVPAAFIGARTLAAAAQAVRFARPAAAGRGTTRGAGCGGTHHPKPDRGGPRAAEAS